MTAIGMRALFATGAFVLAIAPGCGGACQGDTLVPEGPPDVVVRLDPPSLADELDTSVITVVTHLGVDSDRTPAGGAPPPSAATSDAIPAIAATPDANTPDPIDAPEGETPPDDVAASPLETTEPVAQASPPEAVPYVERFRAAYAARQIALSDARAPIIITCPSRRGRRPNRFVGRARGISIQRRPPALRLGRRPGAVLGSLFRPGP